MVAGSYEETAGFEAGGQGKHHRAPVEIALLDSDDESDQHQLDSDDSELHDVVLLDNSVHNSPVLGAIANPLRRYDSLRLDTPAKRRRNSRDS